MAGLSMSSVQLATRHDHERASQKNRGCEIEGRGMNAHATKLAGRIARMVDSDACLPAWHRSQPA